MNKERNNFDKYIENTNSHINILDYNDAEANDDIRKNHLSTKANNNLNNNKDTVRKTNYKSNSEINFSSGLDSKIPRNNDSQLKITHVSSNFNINKSSDNNIDNKSAKTESYFFNKKPDINSIISELKISMSNYPNTEQIADNKNEFNNRSDNNINVKTNYQYFNEKGFTKNNNYNVENAVRSDNNGNIKEIGENQGYIKNNNNKNSANYLNNIGNSNLNLYQNSAKSIKNNSDNNNYLDNSIPTNIINNNRDVRSSNTNLSNNRNFYENNNYNCQSPFINFETDRDIVSGFLNKSGNINNNINNNYSSNTETDLFKYNSSNNFNKVNDSDNHTKKIFNYKQSNVLVNNKIKAHDSNKSSKNFNYLNNINQDYYTNIPDEINNDDENKEDDSRYLNTEMIKSKNNLNNINDNKSKGVSRTNINPLFFSEENNTFNNKQSEWRDLSRIRLTELLEKNKSLQNQLDLVSNSFSNLKKQYNLELTKLQNEISENAYYYNHKLSSIKDQSSLNVSSLLKAKEEEIKLLKNQIKEKEMIIKRISSENTELTDKLHQQKTSFNSNITEIEILITAREREYERDNLELKYKLEMVEKKLKNEYEEETKEVIKENKDYKIKFDLMRKEINEEREDMKNSMDELYMRINKEEKESKETIDKLVKEVQELKKSNIQYKIRNEDLENDINTNKKLIKETSRSTSDKDELISRLNYENSNLKEKIEVLQGNVDKIDRLAYGKLVNNSSSSNMNMNPKIRNKSSSKLGNNQIDLSRDSYRTNNNNSLFTNTNKSKFSNALNSIENNKKYTTNKSMSKNSVKA